MTYDNGITREEIEYFDAPIQSLLMFILVWYGLSVMFPPQAYHLLFVSCACANFPVCVCIVRIQFQKIPGGVAIVPIVTSHPYCRVPNHCIAILIMLVCAVRIESIRFDAF